MNSLKTRRLFDQFFPSEVVAYVSDRSTDYSFTNHAHSLSYHQKQALEYQLGFFLPEVFNIKQVHGDEVIVANKKDAQTVSAADGIITDAVNLPIVIHTADCLPVFIYDPIHRCIGLMHCGWRSSYKEILKKALQMMVNRWNTHPKELKVAFGPAIRMDHYQVGEEFKEMFPKEVVKRQDGYFFDLVKANVNQLVAHGVLLENVYDSGICTYASDEYFSYRREKEKSGRMISLMMLKV